MSTKQKTKEKIRLYEMYSSAVLAGCLSTYSKRFTDTMLKEVDKITKEMIEYHFIYSQECDDEE